MITILSDVRWSSPCLDVCFLDDQWYRSSFHLSGGHLYKFCQFLVRFLVFQRLGCVRSWSILDMNHLLDISFENIVSRSVGCPLVLWMVSFAVEKLFGWMESHGLILILFLLLWETDSKMILTSQTDVREHSTYVFFKDLWLQVFHGSMWFLLWLFL